MTPCCRVSQEREATALSHRLSTLDATTLQELTSLLQRCVHLVRNALAVHAVLTEAAAASRVADEARERVLRYRGVPYRDVGAPLRFETDEGDGVEERKGGDADDDGGGATVHWSATEQAVDIEDGGVPFSMNLLEWIIAQELVPDLGRTEVLEICGGVTLHHVSALHAAAASAMVEDRSLTRFPSSMRVGLCLALVVGRLEDHGS